MLLNFKKTVCITFTADKRKQPETFEIIVDNNLIERVKNTKILGITIDLHLKWDLHIKNLIKKSCYLIYIFKKLVRILNLQQIINVYYAICHSFITYGIIGWGGVYNNYKNILEATQNRVIKLIRKKHSNNKNIQEKIENILSINKTYFYEAIKFNKKYLISEYSKILNRRVKKLKTVYKKKKIGQKSNLYRAVKIFNRMPDSLKNSLNVSKKHSFNNNVKKWLTSEKLN